MPEPTVPFSQLLRERTKAAHRTTESTPFMARLATGKGSREDHTALEAQLYYVYQALEQVTVKLQDDEVAARFITSLLTRVPAIEDDLIFLLGPEWRSEVAPLPATSTYVARIHAMSQWPGGFVAHHYTRYLGDLAGGQAIRSILRRQHGFDIDGVRFYSFPGIESPKAFRDEYRRQLDAAPWDEEEQARIIAEADRAFFLNGELFRQLAEARADAVA